MKIFRFSIVVAGVDARSDDFEVSFFESGCDDAIIALQRGALIFTFDRQGSNFEEAIYSAMLNIRIAGGRPIRVEPDNLVTMADIAARSNLSRSSISNYVAGDRRESFPAPVARATEKVALWDWVQVSEWLRRAGCVSISDDTLEQARAIKRSNESLSSGSIAPTNRVQRSDLLISPSAKTGYNITLSSSNPLSSSVFDLN